MTDVVVVGSGPNGLAAAVTLARAGRDVLVLEEQATPGGGARTQDLALADGIVHDLCSAVHPLAWASPFFRSFDLAAHDVELLTPEVAYAQPLPGGRAAVAYRDLARTIDRLGRDGPAWDRSVGSLARHWDQVVGVALGDKRSLPPDLTARGLLTALRFGTALLRHGGTPGGAPFAGEAASALLTGVQAHANTKLPSPAAAATGLLLAALAHCGNSWAIPRGGSGAITDALVADLHTHGGRLLLEHPVQSASEMPPAGTYLFDTAPRTAAQILQASLPPRLTRALQNYRHGAGVAKVDFVLRGPVPWTAPDVDKAATVHLGGTRSDMIRAEDAVARGRHPEHPLTLVSDPAVLDATRIVDGLRPLWTYAHVPAGSTLDMTAAVTARIEALAPGFTDLVIAARCVPAAAMSTSNANYIEGDVLGGAITLRSMIARPTWRPNPYRLTEDAYLCSASTPPGPGVHGMSGWYAAQHVLHPGRSTATGRRATDRSIGDPR